MKGLEPPRRRTMDPKSIASAVPPHPHGASFTTLDNYTIYEKISQTNSSGFSNFFKRFCIRKINGRNIALRPFELFVIGFDFFEFSHSRKQPLLIVERRIEDAFAPKLGEHSPDLYRLYAFHNKRASVKRKIGQR